MYECVNVCVRVCVCHVYIIHELIVSVLPNSIIVSVYGFSSTYVSLLTQREASIDYGEVGFVAIGHSGRVIVEAAVIISQIGTLVGWTWSGPWRRDDVLYDVFTCALT